MTNIYAHLYNIIWIMDIMYWCLHLIDEVLLLPASLYNITYVRNLKYIYFFLLDDVDVYYFLQSCIIIITLLKLFASVSLMQSTFQVRGIPIHNYIIIIYNIIIFRFKSIHIKWNKKWYLYLLRWPVPITYLSKW